MPKLYHQPNYDGAWPIASAATIDGHPYSGVLNISPAPFDGHFLDWKTSVGNYDGVGLVVDGKMFVAFGKEEEGYGLALYSESAEGLQGVFTSRAYKGAVGTELVKGCNSLPPSDGTFLTEGRQPDKVNYTGKIGIATHGMIQLITWGFDNSKGQFVGAGLLRHGRWITGYGYPGVYSFGCGCYELSPEGILTGEWAIPAYQNATGKEVFQPQQGLGGAAPPQM
jgi:hypothetical protein